MIYQFNGKAPKIDPSAYVSETAVVIGDVEIGQRCFIGPFAVIRGDSVRIVIEEESAIEDCVVVHAGGPIESVRIGKRVTVGHAATVHSTLIKDGANIGMGAVLSLFSEIGEYAVVGECALVKRRQKIPPRVVVGGVTAVQLRELEEKDIVRWEASKDSYVELAAAYLMPGNLKRLD